jgi:hypothetical protein
MKLAITISLALSTACLSALVGCSSAPANKGASSSSADTTIAEEGDSCGGFVANPAQCDESANLYCKSSGVPDMPGTCTTCDGFGALPHIAEVCADGTEQSAHWVAQNGTCVIQVCEANGGTASPGGGGSNSCQQPTDCSGFLPRNQVQCADGTFAGAQWDCVSGACQISYCDNNGGTASSGGNGGGSNSCQQPTDCSGFLPRNEVQCADGSFAGAQWDCVSGACQISYCDNNGGTATTCNDFNPCPSGQTCINQTTGQPAVNGQGGVCQ